jgi:tetratricopeptide (TPR) repeat protein
VLLEESLALSEMGGDRWGIAHTLDLLSVAESERGNLERAMALMAESVQQWRDQDTPLSIALALHRQGAFAKSRGDHAGAVAYYRESLALYQELGHPHGAAAVRSSLAYVAHKRGDDTQAAELLAENMIQYRDTVLLAGLADDLLLLGELAMARGLLTNAARLFSVAAHWWPAPVSWSSELTSTLRVVDKLTAPLRQAELEHQVAAVRAQLGEAEFAANWDIARAMPLKQVIAEAQSISAHTHPESRYLRATIVGRDRSGAEELAPREK